MIEMRWRVATEDKQLTTAGVLTWDDELLVLQYRVVVATKYYGVPPKPAEWIDVPLEGE